MEDPDPRTAGKGHARLREAGVVVTTGVLAEHAARDHSGHVARIKKGRPHVTLKLAVSADGMIGKRVGERMIITSMPSFDAVQAMRTTFDVVMIGIGTVMIGSETHRPAAGTRRPNAVALDPGYYRPAAGHFASRPIGERDAADGGRRADGRRG